MYEGSGSISINVAGLPPLFTMKSELENESTAVPAAPAIALPQTPSSQVALPAPQTSQTSEPTNITATQKIRRFASSIRTVPCLRTA